MLRVPPARSLTLSQRRMAVGIMTASMLHVGPPPPPEPKEEARGRNAAVTAKARRRILLEGGLRGC